MRKAPPPSPAGHDPHPATEETAPASESVQKGSKRSDQSKREEERVNPYVHDGTDYKKP